MLKITAPKQGNTQETVINPVGKTLEIASNLIRFGSKAEQILARTYHEKGSVWALIRRKACQEIVHLRIIMGGHLIQC